MSKEELQKSKAKLAAVRRAISGYLKKIETNLAAEDIDLNELTENLELLNVKEKELKQIDEKVEKLIVDPIELDKELEKIIEYEDKIIISKMRAERKIKELTKNMSDVSASNANKYQNDNIKLPKLSLPIFSGNITEWLTFKDLFTATVYKNDSLSNAQKLQYLKTSLKGDASRIVQSIAISNDNFIIAWNLLDERYSNIREQTFAHIKRFLNLQNVHNESATSLLSLVDNVNEIIRSLEILGQKVNNFGDTLMLYLILQKLDSSTKLWWERSLKGMEIPKLNDLIDFLKSYARTLQNSKSSSNKFQPHVKPPHVKVNSFVSVSVCCMCKENHYISKCPKFYNLSVQQRFDFVKNNNMCINCLSNIHLIKKCKSLNTCFKCHKKHHSLICMREREKTLSPSLSVDANEFIPATSASDVSSNTEVIAVNYCSKMSVSSGSVNNKSSILLCSALVKVRNSQGDLIECKILLDCGSEKNFISKDCLRRLQLKIKPAHISISCLGSVNAYSKGEVDLIFSPHFDDCVKFSASAYVIDKLCGKIPNSSISADVANKFQDLKLADPYFWRSRDVDILLGVNAFFTLVNGEILNRGEDLPFAVGSKLGWIIAGATMFNCNSPQPVLVNNLSVNTDDLVKSFWELEQIPSTQPLTKEETLCETHFVDNFTRNKEGRYCVRLPFKNSRENLGNSKSAAFKMLFSLEKRLIQSPDVYLQYKNFMSEYLALGHMEEINADNLKNENEHYFIPHHHVVNESSPTTKLRVVFNASCKTTSGISLNDTLMNGPKVQDDLFDILIRFRCYNIGITCDLKKMYRQIEIHKDDCEFQKILWRDDPQKPVREYRLRTVTYGTTSASYLATRVLKQLTIDEGSSFPKAASLLSHNFYIDDGLFGAETPDEALELINELRLLLQKGKFELHKWCTNNDNVYKFVSALKDNLPGSTADSKFIKVLGLRWDPSRDEFTYNISVVIDKEEYPTKRTILSCVSRIFDPLGWLAPFIITGKILLQDLWKYQLNWDDPVPEEIKAKWFKYRDEISQLKSITVPRKVLLHAASTIELFCFCDASEKAYASVIYIRSANTSTTHVSLLTSKTRVAPSKTVSIPRLELCAAVLLAHLLQSVLKALQIHIDAIHAFTDSTIVLSWLQSEPSRWKVFVANRVSEIQSILPVKHWNHISSVQNPADCASRGLSPSEMASFQLWWSGPKFLKNGVIPTSLDFSLDTDALKEESKNKTCLVGTTAVDLSVISKFSSYDKLKRVIAWCIRFSKNCKFPSERFKGHLTSSEIKRARNVVVKIIQKQEFPVEYQQLESKKPIAASSKILSLNPFMDQEGLIRVGGRLENTEFSDERKHPILIPKNHHVTSLIILHYHETYLHAGTLTLASIIRKEFWIIHSRSVIKKHIWKCIKCFRVKEKTAAQIMAQLPSSRVTPCRAFSKTGLDYAGPFFVKPRSGRGVRAVKVYLCIFVCFTTKAVHIEVVGNLTAESFVANLKRFVARRGKPSELFSDCGTNFVAANKELLRVLKSLQSDESVHRYFSNEGIKWHFNPASAPHFGGIWEAAVKSAKSHIKRTIGDHILTHEEFSTLITQVESCLNSRPLCPLSDDPCELEPLTPGHFLVGTSLTSIPEENLLDEKISPLHRWKLTQKLFQTFWKRWLNEFISSLQQRPKWFRE